MTRSSDQPGLPQVESPTLAPGSRAHLDRRTFVGLAGKTAFLLGLGGLVFFSKVRRFLRPPGARAEPQFLSLCIKCQKCIEICPTGVIVPVLLTEDVRNAGTPRLNFRVGDCTRCLKCIEACPTGALQPIAKDDVRLGVAVVDQTKCIAWTWLGCTLCERECPVTAILLDEERRPVVDTAQCNGCGRCELICIAPIARSYGRGGGTGIVVVPVGPG